MKQSGTCPKCKARDVLHVARVADYGYRHDRPWRFAATSEPKVFGGVHGAGEVEAFVCRSCRYIEFYAVDPSALPVDGRHIRAIKRSKAGGPFR